MTPTLTMTLPVLPVASRRHFHTVCEANPRCSLVPVQYMFKLAPPSTIPPHAMHSLFTTAFLSLSRRIHAFPFLLG